MKPISERLTGWINMIDEGANPIPGWFLTAGGFIDGTIVSRAAFEHTFYNNIRLQMPDGSITTMYEELTKQPFELPPPSDPPNVLLIDATIYAGSSINSVPCMFLRQEDLISWGLAQHD